MESGRLWSLISIRNVWWVIWKLKSIVTSRLLLRHKSCTYRCMENLSWWATTCRWTFIRSRRARRSVWKCSTMFWSRVLQLRPKSSRRRSSSCSSRGARSSSTRLAFSTRRVWHNCVKPSKQSSNSSWCRARSRARCLISQSSEESGSQLLSTKAWWGTLEEVWRRKTSHLPHLLERTPQHLLLL